MKMLLHILLTVCFSGAAWSGSLYKEGQFKAYAEDRKAVNVGDVLTVLVLETATAETSTDTKAQRGSEYDANINYDGKDDWRAYKIDAVADFGASSSSGGGGKVRRAGKLRAQITVIIEEKTEEGLLKISGEQTILLNDEQQKIRIRGMVRPEDIEESNTVVSSRLANAEIEFVGEGEVNASQKPSIFYSIMNWLRLI